MKTLYIGIGGNGVKTLAAIKRKMESYEQFRRANGDQVINNDEFLFLDTDTKDILGIPGVDLEKDFVSLDITPATQYDWEKDHSSADATRFFEWYDGKKTGTSPHPLSSGAGAIRMDGRLGLYANRVKFMKFVYDKLDVLNTATRDQNLNTLPICIYVFSGTSGGTGSGILLDVLMTIDKKYTEIIQDPNKAPSTTLFLFGPNQTFTIERDGTIKTKKACNGAAFLFELDAIKRCTVKNNLGSHKIFNRFSGWVNDLELTRPFHFPKYVYYLDNTLTATGLTQTQTVSYDVMHDLAADFVFNLEVGKSNKYYELANNNDISGIGALDSILVNGDQNGTDANGFFNMFNTFAPLTVCFPKELFSLYCSTRFNVECFKVLRGNEIVGDIDIQKADFKNKLEKHINDLKKGIGEIFNSAEKSKKTVAAGISVNQTERRIMYEDAAAPEFYRNMAPAFNNAKEIIKNFIYEYFANKLQTEGVGGVIEIVSACDGMLTTSSTNRKNEVIEIPQPKFMQRDAGYFKEVWECIEKLIEIEIFDYCSLGNEGVLDQVTKNLEALRGAFRSKMLEVIKEQGEFIGTLNAENSNPLRQYIPRPDTIVKNNNFIAGNEFERTYNEAFTENYIKTVRQDIFADNTIQNDILDIVKIGDTEKATGIVVTMARMICDKFSSKFADDDKIRNYSETTIKTKLDRKIENGDNSYQRLITGHQGALFPTNGAVFNAHTHRRMILADSKSDENFKKQYRSDVPIDDPFFADRVVSFYITNGLSINDITSLKETYLPELNKDENKVHPAFSDKRFDITPITKDTIYEVMTGGSVELNIDLLTLLMLCLLDVKVGKTDGYKAGDRVDGTVSYTNHVNSETKECRYYYQIFNDQTIQIAFPKFEEFSGTGVLMSEYEDTSNRTLENGGIGKNYTQQEKAIQETKDCYKYVLKGNISETVLNQALIRLRSMLKIRLNDKDVQFRNFTDLLENPRYKYNFETSVIESNISLL